MKDLRVGDIVTLKNKSGHPITNIRQYRVPPTKVYNIEVEDNHNYFVGDAGVWVHNYEIEHAKLPGSYANSGFFDRVGQRFSNWWNDRGFNTDADVVQRAWETNGIMGKVAAESQLGYSISNSDANLVKETYFPYKDSKTGTLYKASFDGLYDTEYGAPLPIRPEMTRGFGVPTKGQNAAKEHSGLDIRTLNCPNAECNIVAVGEGTVIGVENRKTGSTYSKNSEDYKTGKAQYGPGNFVKIRYQNGYEVTDMHLSSVKVKVGDRVRRGQVIGVTGNTGNSEASHLHHEVSNNGKPVQPLEAYIQ